MRQAGAIGWLKHDITHRGVTAWTLTALLFGFYLVLYFTEGLTAVAKAIHLSSKWDLYGLLYTVAILSGGSYVIWKYRHNRYQIVRTAVVMTVQTTFAFAIPHLLEALHQPGYYFSYLWPLKIEYFYPSTIFQMPLPFILYSFLGSLLMVPILGIVFGKRWYCSWICGCGGLANTAGEPFRHLSSKTEGAWRFEKVAIHTVLGLSFLVTALVVMSAFVGNAHPQLQGTSDKLRDAYGLVVSMMLSGVIGVGLYPVGGTRVWCRNFCPMAALLGLVQKIGRFRIRVKPDMCISCGMCTKYCEMGIDVRAYAQTNQTFTRAACVGCGMCAEVCPRGVLSLEARWGQDPQQRALRPAMAPSDLVQIRLHR
ncbi:MAG TPA: 4Fe-4S dicluster-binding protein [Polyangia bacterium]|jgi:polyferredoxin|nr:4Fe-4S dicluster-binding protein [Polyangia bacterium]